MRPVSGDLRAVGLVWTLVDFVMLSKRAWHKGAARWPIRGSSAGSALTSFRAFVELTPETSLAAVFGPLIADKVLVRLHVSNVEVRGARGAFGQVTGPHACSGSTLPDLARARDHRMNAGTAQGCAAAPARHADGWQVVRKSPRDPGCDKRRRN